MGQDEVLSHSFEHPFAVVVPTELDRRALEQRLDVSGEALWGGVVEMICDVRDAQPRVFEESSGADETRHGEVAFGVGVRNEMGGRERILRARQYSDTVLVALKARRQ